MKQRKNMKRILFAIILSLIVIMAAKGSQVIGAITYNNTNRNVVVAPGEGGTKNVDISTASSVTLAHSDSAGRTYVSSGGLSVVSALYQPNIWCAQSGSELDYGTFSVSGEYTVSDPSLAYILNQGPSMGSLQSNWISTAQIAFWEYLDRSSSSDARNINSGISNEFRYGTVKGYWDKITSADFDTAWGNGASIYEASKTYANSTGNVQPTVKLSLGSNGIDVTVGGQCTNYTLYIDGNRYNSYSKGSGASKVVTIPYTDSRLSGKSKVTIKAEASYSEYYARYSILKNSSLQRLIVVTDVGNNNRTKSAQASIDLKVNISLQKYIVQVNGQNLTSAQTKLTNREDAYASPIDVPVFNGKTDNRPNYYYDSPSNPAAKNKAKTYKRQSSSSSPEDENVVYIEAGDTVTYRIKVYNNDKIDATRFVIGDTFPSAVATWVGAKNANGQTVSWTKQNDTQYYYSIPGGLKAGTSTYFDVTLKYTKYSPNLWTNCAYIEARNPNKTDEGHNFPIYTIPNAPAWGPNIYRTSDYDHIKMRPYKVSLEKFITKVEGGVNKNETPSPSRAGKRFNLNASNKSNTSNYNTWKDNNQYAVEPGDKITYTIRLANTGDYPVKISQITDTFWYVNGNNGIKLVYDSSYGIRGNGGGRVANSNYKSTSLSKTYLIAFDNATLIQPGRYVDVTIRFTLDMPASTTNMERRNIDNTAVITELKNRNNVVVPDSDGTDNNEDCDIVKTKTYAVKLEKYISRVNNTTRDAENTTLNRSGKPEHYNDNNANTTNNWKSNNVAVVGKGDEVTYTITVTNEHANTSVYITNIKDTLPTGISQYKVGNGSWRSRPSNGVINITDTRNTFLAPGKSTSVTVTVKVTESNLSLNVFKNEAEITEMKNRNQVTVIDTTLNNNKDADYFELKDITIHGKVWNDVARNKTNDSYNGKYESGKKEKLLEDITVRLFRNNTEVATTKTNNNGEYTFSRSNLNSNLADNTKYIKGPRNTPTNNRWSGTYYSYYVVFEYDGITYTCSLNNQQNPTYVPVNTSLPTDYKIDSNAAENNGKVNMTRENFNKQFTTIKNDGAYNANNQKSMNLEYDTKNENGYVPQSIHKTKANIQASTNLINLSNNNNLEEQLLNVDLGLRGRDIFDLHLDSSVAHTDLSVHGQTTRYEYEDNEKASVTFKPEDLGIVEDMANVAREKVDGEADVNSNGTKKENATDYGVSQNIRRGDYNANYANANDITGQTRHNTQNVDLNIKVTYRINVVNESQTDGYANIIRDYYDNRYKLANANLVYQERELKNGKETVKYETTIAKSSVTDNVDSGNGFSAVSIPLPNGRVLSQDRMAVVYITFEMKDPNATLKPMVDGKTTKVPTYNMAEIWQYTTKGTRSQTEFTRGLLDKDSAPGSANREQVRKVSTQGRNTSLTGGNPTTVKYYFERPSQSGSNQYWKAKNDLTDLKYEDDTYAAPTLFFVDRTVQRVLSGTIFRDGTSVANNTYIKTGNGKQDSDEKGVAGVLVELLEVENNGNLKPIISTHTKADGSFTLTKFMPAKYALRYTYGSTRQCIVAYAVNANTNEDSFNGEDYQSTNNTGNRAGVARLADTDKDYWYITNASNKISTGTDDVNRRRTVARTVTGYTDAQMRTLQKARNTKDDRSITLSNSEVQQIADSTKMYSNTPNFLVAVEKPTGLTSKSTRFTDTYIIEEMDLGLMETPKTEITLEKKITSFTIKDASGTNTLASWNINSGKSAGDVLKLNEGDGYDVSIVDDQLQGAKLEVTFKINANVKVERNYDATGNPVQPITAVADFIDNDLSFNADLLVGDGTEHTNADYWTIVPYQTSGGVEGIQDTLRRRANEAKAYIGTVSPSDTRYNGTNGYGTLDQPGKAYSVIVKATNSNPILSPTKTSTGYTSTSSITLEKVLSSEETTIRDIVTSNINTYEYNNHVEVLNLDYTNTKTGATGNDFIFMDRIIRNPRDNDPDYDDELYGRDDKTEYVMIAGVQHDSAESERITVHPPTGEMKGNQYYYVAIGAIMIIILGVAGIKKIALKEE